MKYKCFSIRDVKAQIYHPPFFKGTIGEAERDFDATVQNPQMTIHQYPSDFELFCVGEYDSDTARFLTYDQPQYLMSAVQCLQKKPTQTTLLDQVKTDPV